MVIVVPVGRASVLVISPSIASLTVIVFKVKSIEQRTVNGICRGTVLTRLTRSGFQYHSKSKAYPLFPMNLEEKNVKTSQDIIMH